MKHLRNIQTGKYDGVDITSQMTGLEEWSTYLHNYKNQGLYPRHGEDIIRRISQYGFQGRVYDFTTFYKPQWWHFIYKIPRQW